MSHFVGNPEDRFGYVGAHVRSDMFTLCIIMIL